MEEIFHEQEILVRSAAAALKPLSYRLILLCRLKGLTARKYGLATQPRLVDIIAAVPPAYKDALLPKLKAKPVRTASGIAVVAVMCKPHRCPHVTFTGNICVYVSSYVIPPPPPPPPCVLVMLVSVTGTVQVVRTLILSTPHSHTLDMSLHPCGQFVLAITLICKLNTA